MARSHGTCTEPAQTHRNQVALAAGRWREAIVHFLSLRPWRDTSVVSVRLARPDTTRHPEESGETGVTVAFKPASLDWTTGGPTEDQRGHVLTPVIVHCCISTWHHADVCVAATVNSKAEVFMKYSEAHWHINAKVAFYCCKCSRWSWLKLLHSSVHN